MCFGPLHGHSAGLLHRLKAKCPGKAGCRIVPALNTI